MSKTLENAPKTVLDFLVESFGHLDKLIWQKRFDNQEIFVKTPLGYQVLTCQDDYCSYQGLEVYYYRFVANEVVVPFDYRILYENERLLVVDKPHFLTISPSGNYVTQTLLARLKHDTQNPHITPIHRLDKDTAGVVLFCKDKAYRGVYQSLFSEQCIDKTYHAIAKFCQDRVFPVSVAVKMVRGEPFYTMQVVDGTPNSHTDIHLLAVSSDAKWAKYELHPSTGKLHQLRVHLNHLGLPIKNDPYYPRVCHRRDDDFDNPLQLLAKELKFIDPIDKQLKVFCSSQELLLD